MNALHVIRKTVSLNYCDTLLKENVTIKKRWMGPSERVCVVENIHQIWITSFESAHCTHNMHYPIIQTLSLFLFFSQNTSLFLSTFLFYCCLLYFHMHLFLLDQFKMLLLLLLLLLLFFKICCLFIHISITNYYIWSMN